MNMLRAIFAQRILMQSAPTPDEPCVVGADLDPPGTTPEVTPYVRLPGWCRNEHVARDLRATHLSAERGQFDSVAFFRLLRWPTEVGLYGLGLYHHF